MIKVDKCKKLRFCVRNNASKKEAMLFHFSKKIIYCYFTNKIKTFLGIRHFIIVTLH